MRQHARRILIINCILKQFNKLLFSRSINIIILYSLVHNIILYYEDCLYEIKCATMFICFHTQN